MTAQDRRLQANLGGSQAGPGTAHGSSPTDSEVSDHGLTWRLDPLDLAAPGQLLRWVLITER